MNETNFKALKKIGDVEYYDGPLLSLFTSNKGQYFLYKWVTVNKDSHSWLVFETNFELLVKYITQKLSMPDLIITPKNKDFYVVKIDNDLNYIDIQQESQEEVIQKYVPEDIFFDSFYFEDLQEIMYFLFQRSIFEDTNSELLSIPEMLTLFPDLDYNSAFQKIAYIKNLHQQAMTWKAKTIADNKSKVANKKYLKKALELEKEAALTMPLDKTDPLPRFLLCKNAILMALDLEDFAQAEQLIAIFQNENPTTFLKNEMKKLTKRLPEQRPPALVVN